MGSEDQLMELGAQQAALQGSALGRSAGAPPAASARGPRLVSVQGQARELRLLPPPSPGAERGLRTPGWGGR